MHLFSTTPATPTTPTRGVYWPRQVPYTTQSLCRIRAGDRTRILLRVERRVQVVSE